MFHGLDLMVGKMVTKDTSQCIWDITTQYITNVRNPMTNPCSHPDQSCICNALVALSADMSEMPLPPEDGSVQKGRRNHNCSSHSESHAEKQTVGPKES